MQQLGYKAAMHKFREWHCNLKLPSNCTRNILLVSVKNTFFLILSLTKHFIFQFNQNKGSSSLELKHFDHFVDSITFRSPGELERFFPFLLFVQFSTFDPVSNTSGWHSLNKTSVAVTSIQCQLLGKSGADALHFWHPYYSIAFE